MAKMDTVRFERLQKRMAGEGFDALVCRLPENVTYLTSYWPHHGVSVAVLPREGRPVLLVPEVEAPWADEEWAQVIPFAWSLLTSPPEYDSFREFLTGVRNRFSLAGKTVGVEEQGEVIGPTYRAAEPIIPAAPWHALLAEVFAGSTLKDATELLRAARGIKTEYEIEKLKVAAEIAEMGIRHAIEHLEPGITEAQIGALVEYKIRADGPGHKGARLMRPSAEVAAGPNSTRATLLIPSTTYAVQEGDLVMIELGLIVDGYWSDLTYMALVGGKPSVEQRRVHNALLEAQKAATEQVRPGSPASEPDRVARAVLKRFGLDEYFVHITGHGIGLRYHEPPPLLMPGNNAVLEVGMVTSVEPGVYIPGFGGIRIEDNVLVGPDGPVVLSTPREPW